MHLTAEGKRWAHDNLDSSIVARIALTEDARLASEWPVEHRRTAVEACNAKGSESPATRRCFCPGDCGCRHPHRTNVCGCKQH
jgi:hypothetical protein